MAQTPDGRHDNAPRGAANTDPGLVIVALSTPPRLDTVMPSEPSLDAGDHTEPSRWTRFGTVPLATELQPVPCCAAAPFDGPEAETPGELPARLP